MLSIMKKRKNGIPGDKLEIFERIIQTHYVSNRGSDEGDNKFMEAIGEHLTEAQRFRLWEQHGGCMGTGHDKERKAFALEHAGKPLTERLKLFEKTFNRRKTVLNGDNTITVKFACTHGYYKRAREGKCLPPPASIGLYFERCAGGRLYEYQKALGIKLKIKSVDVSPLSENIQNPVVFTFEIVE